MLPTATPGWLLLPLMRPIFVAEGDRSDTQRVHMNVASLVLNQRAEKPVVSAPT